MEYIQQSLSLDSLDKIIIFGLTLMDFQPNKNEKEHQQQQQQRKNSKTLHTGQSFNGKITRKSESLLDKSM